MSIPIQVKIGGMLYDVQVTNEVLLLDNRQCKGLIDYEHQSIKIADETVHSEQSQQVTFWHELIHAFVYERQLEWPEDKNELWTEELARCMHAFCVDNNLKFAKE